MSTPIASPADLATYLGISDVDTTRATQLIGIAQGFCEDIVSPLPSTAFGVVLAAAARSYANPQGVTGEAMGPFHVQRPGGVYLTKYERAALRRAAGRGGAMSTSTLAAAANAVQTVTVTATAGTFTLSLYGVTTTELAYNAAPADVQVALAALGPVGAGNIAVTGSTGSYRVEFVNALAGTPVPTLVADGSGLTGSAVVTVTALGVGGAASNLPGWDYDYANHGIAGSPL